MLLFCSKCQNRTDGPLRKVKKVLGKQVRVVRLGCLKICPRDGVVMCTQEQMGRGVCTIVRSERDVLRLVRSVEVREPAG